MQLPTVWTRETWRRAARPTIPVVAVTGGHMVSEATQHHADYVGQDRWVVDFLPGRQLTPQQARAAMNIAVAPDMPEVQRWATQLGMTPAEVRGYIAMPAEGAAAGRGPRLEPPGCGARPSRVMDTDRTGAQR